jgi:transposase
MKQGIESIPSTSSTSHSVVQELAAVNTQLKEENQQLKAKYDALLEQIRLFQHQRYGARSEKFHPHQLSLFNEAELIANETTDDEVGQPTEDSISETKAQQPHPVKRGRKALPKELPRIDVIHELLEAQRRCPEGHELNVIGEEVSEQLDIIPAKIQVLRHIKKKYACRCCEAHVRMAQAPLQPIPKSNASVGLLAHIVTSKFQDAITHTNTKNNANS